jgi:hypothetical protein
MTNKLEYVTAVRVVGGKVRGSEVNTLTELTEPMKQAVAALKPQVNSFVRDCVVGRYGLDKGVVQVKVKFRESNVSREQSFKIQGVTRDDESTSRGDPR